MGIRPVQPEEFPLLSRIEDRAGVLFEQIGMHLAAGVNVADRGELPLAAFVAGEPPVGFVWVVSCCGQAHIEELAVLPSHGRRGIGGSLLEAACRWAGSSGYRQVTLCTFRDVPWNGPFYRSAGFVELEEDEWCPELAEVRAAERAAGLDELSPRVAMIRRLHTAPASGSRTGGGR